MEKSQHTNEQIIKVISFILSRLDTLEVEQSRHKEMFFKVRKNLTDANDLINQILDVLEVENPELFEKTVQNFKPFPQVEHDLQTKLTKIYKKGNLVLKLPTEGYE